MITGTMLYVQPCNAFANGLPLSGTYQLEVASLSAKTPACITARVHAARIREIFRDGQNAQQLLYDENSIAAQSLMADFVRTHPGKQGDLITVGAGLESDDREKVNAERAQVDSAGCSNGPDFDPVLEEQYLAIRDEYWWKVSCHSIDLSDIAPSAETELASLRQMKADGFEKRHAALYSRYLERTHQLFDQINNTFDV